MKELKPLTIYVWQDTKDHYLGVAEAKGTRFYSAWDIEKDKDKKDEKREHMEWRAKNLCVRQLNNTLNAVELYGNKILTKDGEIDPGLFHQEELFGVRVAHMTKRNFNKEKPLKKFKVVSLTLDEATSLEL